MNYLVHFLLSGDDDDLRLGNLLGDHVKGRVQHYAHPGVTERIRAGIQLHRTIDSFSDQHPVVHRSKVLLAPRYGRMAGVIVDVFYDHVLARTWARHHPQTLRAFSQDIYRTLSANLPRLPAAVHPLVRAMTRGDWLLAYADVEGIDGALRGMAGRVRVAAGIGTASRELVAHYDVFERDFGEFMPELTARCARFLEERASSHAGMLAAGAPVTPR